MIPRLRGLRAPGCRGFLYVGVAPCLSTSAVAVNAPFIVFFSISNKSWFI